MIEPIGAGGLTGSRSSRALAVVKRVRARLGAGPCVIGVGGIETGEDAAAMLRVGADLVQVYTGFVYRGPRTPALVARELLAAMQGAEAAPRSISIQRLLFWLYEPAAWRLRPRRVGDAHGPRRRLEHASASCRCLALPRTRRFALWMTAALGTNAALVAILKAIIGRDRPCRAVTAVKALVFAAPMDCSLPSGDAAAASASRRSWSCARGAAACRAGAWR